MNSVQVLCPVCLGPILMFSSALICSRGFFSVGFPAKVPCAFSHYMLPPPLKSIWRGHPDKCSAKCIISRAEWSPDRQVRVVRFAVEPRDCTKMSRPDRGPPSLLIRWREAARLPPAKSEVRNERNCIFTPPLAFSWLCCCQFGHSHPRVKHLLMYETKYHSHTK
jgi:hypothetical protein